MATSSRMPDVNSTAGQARVQSMNVSERDLRRKKIKSATAAGTKRNIQRAVAS